MKWYPSLSLKFEIVRFMKIRKAIPEDLPILNQISVASKRHWQYPEEWIQRWLEDLTLNEGDLQNQEIHVLEVDEKLIGFCGIAEDSEAYEVAHLWVLPEYIGKGYGKKLLNASISNVAIDKKKIRLVADPNAENFYQSQGFKKVEEVESYPEGRFLPVMERV